MFKCVFMLLMFAVTTTFASMEIEQFVNSQEHHLLHKLLENQAYCIHSVDDDKIFVHWENLIATENGLFLDINGVEFVALPLLQRSHTGYFLQTGLLSTSGAKAEKTRGPCPACGIDTSSRGRCMNEACTFYGFKVID